MISMNIQNFIQQLWSFCKRVWHTARPDPVRDWLVMLSIFFVAFVSILLANVWAFKAIEQGGGTASSANTTSTVLNRASLDAVRAILDQRAAEEEKYKSGAYHFTDPSQ